MLLRFVRKLSQHKSRRVSVKDLWNTAPKPDVIVSGWVKSIRKHKKVTFLEINDGSCPRNLQVVLPIESFPDANYFYGSAIEIDGELISRPKAKPSVELLGKSVLQHRECDSATYPFASEWDHPYKFIRQFPHLRPRQRPIASILRIRNKVEMLVHEYFQHKNFVHIHTPAITSSDCEGAGELFSVTTSKDSEDENGGGFFGVPAYLTVSGQLHLEACAMGVGDVYTLSPAFRAEQSRPNTHLSEFHMLEVEVAFTKCMDEVISLLENSLQYVISKTLESCSEDLEVFYGVEDGAKYRDIVKKCATEPFLKLDYSQVLEILNSNSSTLKSGEVKWGAGLSAEHETFITTYHGNRPVFVTNFPTCIKPFYVQENKDESGTCNSFDLLFPNCGEMAGGTMREDNFDILSTRLRHLGLDSNYRWYTELRQFGGVPHGGYGLGFDRLVKFIVGVKNIRDVIPFPRASKLCLL